MNSPERKVNGARVTQVRELRGLTRNELSIMCGLAHAVIAQIESGEFAPSQAMLQAIAINTGFDIEFFRQGYPPTEFPMLIFNEAHDER